MGIPSTPIKPGTTVTGKVSWFGGPGDSSSGPTTASGLPVSVPGIALYNRATLGGYWRVTAPNGRTTIVRQTDLGPAPWTGRSIDFTYTSLGKFGYTQGNFPTDAVAHATYLGQKLPAGATVGQAMPQTGGGGGKGGGIPGMPGVSIPSLNFNTKGYQQAQARYLLGNLQKQTGNLFSPNEGSLGNLGSPLSLAGMPDPNNYLHTTYQKAQNDLGKLAGQPLKLHPQATPGYKGYVNPIPGFSLGRTDQGVDASARAGQPIRALGDSRLAQVIPNWYSGQPLLLFQILNGPKKGQYWYVSEQINPTTTQIGHVFHAGQPVATFASSGTGIEIGWGSPTSNARTLAGATTGYTEGQVTPAGQSFRNFLGGVGG